ncbi:MAG: D-alanyl-D-alanine carboxypeptidase, partial [Firmicutes bacterium]|nr:D-alanyl-D-alanine carboxypeptidase [Bacillota bacterium]
MQKIKIFSIIIIILSIFIKNISDVYGLNNDSSDISSKINAEGYVIMDANNHDILFSKNENNRYEPASVTKIMTAILVIENVQDLHTKITIGENPPKTEPSSIYLVQGEIIDIKSLLYALLLQSANDAAVALAEYVGGSVKGFEKMMNDKAAALGCTNTHFANPNGLHAENHYTTAKDMALILSYAIKNQTLLDISQTEQYFIPETNLGPVREIYNQNRILLKDNENYYDKAIFAKTGYTDEAQHTFAVAAKNDKMTLVAVFLKDSVKGYNIYAKDCLEYAFDNYTNHTIYNKGDFVINYNIKGTFVQLMAENSINITIKNGTNIVKNISDIVLIDPERYSYSKGEEVATSKLIINGISYDLALESKEDITLASTVNSI